MIMKLQIITDLENKVYKCEFHIKDITPQNVENIHDLGESELVIDVAGDIKATTTTKTPVVNEHGAPVMGLDGQPTYTTKTEETLLLPQGSKFLRFPSEFTGYKREFNDRMLSGKAEEIAKAYVEIMEKRVRELVTRIEEHNDDFTNDREILL